MNALHSFAGTVTCTVWLATPKADISQQFWAPCWRIITDSMIAASLGADVRFKSTEGWSLAAYSSEEAAAEGEEPLAFIPGCKVAGWVACGPPAAGPVHLLGVP